MGRQSSIRKLPPEIRKEVHRLIGEGATIDAIVEQLQNLGADISRSATGRYKQKYEDQLKRYREAREVASVWVQKIGKDPDSDVGLLLGELLKTVAFSQLADMAGSDKPTKPMDIMLLAKAIQSLESSTTAGLKRRDAIRKQVIQEAAKVVDKAARRAGLSDQARQLIENELNLM